MIRIGESRLMQARDQRWTRAYDALDPVVLSLQEEEAPRNRRAVRLGILVAVVFHVVLFFIYFPETYSPKVHKIGSVPRVYRLKQVKFSPPPKPRARPTTIQPKAKRIPVPDATPDDPEPIVSERADVSEIDFPEVGTSVSIPQGPPGPAIGPMQIGGNVLAPVRIFAPDPQYPEEARHGRVQGVVILQTIIDVLGNVTDIRVLKGLPSGLTESAVEAVSKWRFEPATLEGEPVAVYYLVTVSFSVQ